MQIRWLLPAWILCAALTVAAQDPPPVPNVGGPAPEFDFDKLVQTPLEPVGSLAALRGKVVVLEFWEPWSKRSTEAIPHLNDVASRLRGKPVYFIAVTSEAEQAVRQFLRDQPMNAWVWLDEDKTMFRSYAASPLPHVVVIDQQGKIAAVTAPDHLTAAAIQDLLGGKQISLPVKECKPVESKAEEVARKEGPEPFLQVVIGRSDAPPSSFSAKYDLHKGRLSFKAAPLPYMVAVAYQISPARVIWMPPLSEQRYRVTLVAPSTGKDATIALFRYVLKTTFGLRVRRGTRAVACLVLRRDEATPWMLPESNKKTSPTWIMPLRVRAQGCSLASLAGGLEAFLGVPVVDETGLAGKYDFDLRFKEGNRKSFEAALKELGLQLRETTKSIKLLLVEQEL